MFIQKEKRDVDNRCDLQCMSFVGGLHITNYALQCIYSLHLIHLFFIFVFFYFCLISLSQLIAWPPFPNEWAQAFSVRGKLLLGYGGWGSSLILNHPTNTSAHVNYCSCKYLKSAVSITIKQPTQLYSIISTINMRSSVAINTMSSEPTEHPKSIMLQNCHYVSCGPGYTR